ncbi:hypothetical protein COO60DRAFT_410550 [Scenedesmus sp. NREL 46B-D3]|nr:hypothetical protein COO60DRAFT_410550 [Scenedesmus sp. NREL 46B-D3]
MCWAGIRCLLSECLIAGTKTAYETNWSVLCCCVIAGECFASAKKAMRLACAGSSLTGLPPGSACTPWGIAEFSAGQRLISQAAC